MARPIQLSSSSVPRVAQVVEVGFLMEEAVADLVEEAAQSPLAVEAVENLKEVEVAE